MTIITIITTIINIFGKNHKINKKMIFFIFYILLFFILSKMFTNPLASLAANICCEISSSPELLRECLTALGIKFNDDNFIELAFTTVFVYTKFETKLTKEVIDILGVKNREGETLAYVLLRDAKDVMYRQYVFRSMIIKHWALDNDDGKIALVGWVIGENKSPRAIYGISHIFQGEKIYYTPISTFIEHIYNNAANLLVLPNKYGRTLLFYAELVTLKCRTKDKTPDEITSVIKDYDELIKFLPK